MTKLADDSKFDFDGVEGTFTSKPDANGKTYQYATKSPGYKRGKEGDSITHIFHGHTDNDFTATENKSIFLDKTKVLDFIDDAMKKPAASRINHPTIPNAFTIDLDPAIVGKPRGSAAGITTSKITIILRQENGVDIIDTAYPE